MTKVLLRKNNFITKKRLVKDSILGMCIGLGGISVICAIVLIFFYLLYIVLPVFQGAQATFQSRYELPQADAGNSLDLVLEEQTEVGLRYTDQAKAVFFSTQDGTTLAQEDLKDIQADIISYARSAPINNLAAFGLANGRVVVVEHNFEIRFDGERRHIEAKILYPLTQNAIIVDKRGTAIEHLAIERNENGLLIASAGRDNKIVLTLFSKQESFLDDSQTWISQSNEGELLVDDIKRILINNELSRLFVISAKEELSLFDISDLRSPKLLQRLRLLSEDTRLSTLGLLSGGVSLMAASEHGDIGQWFAVKDQLGNLDFEKIRHFKVKDSHAIKFVAENYRKGFVVASANGKIHIFHATAGRHLLSKQITQAMPVHIALAPRANALLLQDKQGWMHFWHIDNLHPEVSWQALWGKVWYENHRQPEYIWQSSASSDDFEPKLSLVPLAFGTLKSAFYALLFAIPLAIYGAIYTAYFMAPSMRSAVKPSIEIMEALPTVILGFLAGLWLAPFVEAYLAGVLALFILLPPGTLLGAYLYGRMPTRVRSVIPPGWEAALMIVPIVLIVALSVALSPFLEVWFFNGDMRVWMAQNWHIDFDQRNAIIVGIAMGFAVIPTIFSMAEDAIFGVPKHLSNGSLALGASPWQTLARVVLLTASPGIFAAVMIGTGRAVGETMIVLMATGNTPLMDLSIFQGMRTLAANIAVEMPESEVRSTHYRILFLAGLVLLLFTFMVNTIAEVVRQRLREKYSSL